MKRITHTLVFFLTALLLGKGAMAQNTNHFEVSKNLDIFATLYQELNKYYVDEIKPAEIMESGINAMLKDLDPYTVYIPESRIEDYRLMTTGQYGGIGALIHQRDSLIAIAEPYEGFPAQKAGLIPGDRLLKIDDKSVSGKSSSDVSALLKGQPGTPLRITILREGQEKPLVKELKREKIQIKSLPYYGMLENQVGYIKLTDFTQNAGREVKNALQDLKSQNSLKGLIIDLRGNGGGLLNEAVNICNLFVDKGQLIVSTKGKLSNKNKSYKTLSMPIDKELPLIVMANESSASASEIVAGALQDLDRAVIVGQRTFGKGLVQNVIPLSYNTQMKVTVAKYYIPSGRCIQEIDYSHKNNNGGFEKYADSLKTAFKTQNGRLVYDGGGISPDIKIEPEMLSHISASLFSKFLFFDFANQFAREHQNIPAPDQFEITDEIYADFKAFLQDKDYNYVTQSEKTLKKLKEIAQKEKYFNEIETEFQQLENNLKAHKSDDLNKFRQEISEILKVEIASRYYYQKGKIVASLQDDPEIKRAVELLNQPTAYRTLLDGPTKEAVSN